MQAQSILELLPLEILLTVLGCLSHNSLLRLRLVSKFLLRQVTPIVFSDLSLDINESDEDRFHQNLWLVKCLATSSSPISSSVLTLRLVSLFSPRYRRVGYTERVLRDKEPGPDEGTARAVLSEYLVPFLLKLQNIETVLYIASPVFKIPVPPQLTS
jgi:hypothetical protein